MGYRIAVLPGDGIGPEIVSMTWHVLQKAAAREDVELRFAEYPVGLTAKREYGSTLPDRTLAGVKESDGCILGPVTHHVYDIFDPAMINPSGYLRKYMDLYANIRPARSLPGVKTRFENVDLVVVRENTEGFYADRNVLDGNGELRPDEDTVISVRVVTRKASLRIAEQAFALARARGGKKRVSVVHKANVLRRGCGLFLDCCRQVARAYPDIAMQDFHVDAFAMHLVMDPEPFDVVVTTNLFGDVLSDQAAGLVGGLGMVPGLNAGDTFAMAQATHGSAPDIAGQGIANPVAEVLSGAMLLQWLGQVHEDERLRRAAGRVDRAVAAVVKQGEGLTPDLGGSGTTKGLGDLIQKAV